MRFAVNLAIKDLMFIPNKKILKWRYEFTVLEFRNISV